MPRRSKLLVLNTLKAGGLVPVIRTESVDVAVRVTDALVAGGVRTIEITMTVPDALTAIRSVGERFGEEILLGAGTVTSREMALGALNAGAEFLVTPCLVPEVIATAREHGAAVLPGAMTPTEVFSAWTLGGDIVKVFPASQAGGASYLKALAGPFPQIELCPTGGVNLETIAGFIEAGAVAVGVGGELVLKSAIAGSAYDRISDLARRYVDALARAREAHPRAVVTPV
jgi:2-dehydro-3-deoxyphosphogluconate aldolase / (4S)-4-hydroxy-2-oxoglutarate aldolase